MIRTVSMLLSGHRCELGVHESCQVDAVDHLVGKVGVEAHAGRQSHWHVGSYACRAEQLSWCACPGSSASPAVTAVPVIEKLINHGIDFQSHAGAYP